MSAMAVRSADLKDVPSAEAWRAVESRDARYDGRFVYAVRSTGVFCRPSCPSRRALRANVEFYSTTAAAERAGFRACRRCRPTEDASANPAIERARLYLDAHADRLVALEELASHAGLSASHLQRSFKRLVGVSPREYQAENRMRRLKSRLRAGDTVSRATYAAGFNSSRGVYERASASLGMTPAAYRRGGAGVHMGYTIADAPVGRVLVATTERGVCAVELGATDADVERSLRADFPNASIERKDDAHETWVRAVLDRVREPVRAPYHRIPLDVSGTEFQRRVWDALRAIPAGERRSYAEVAEAIGSPKSSRAVAQACASNRLAVVIPCHRVVRGDGEISGYKWGVQRKRMLLAKESD
jgi:AraC family transcriptional regulator, regulatory protein of adaptative response / methylated-DNA-[protein]-cysteine methyltransferase